jgi:SAM-dependent methyltransferase
MSHNGPVIGERDGLRVIDCRACGWAHLETMPSDDDLARFYESEFWQVEKAGALDRIEQQRDWWAAVYGDWLELVERHTLLGWSLLDVGCGYGHFMKSAIERDWNTWGIEPNKTARRYCSMQGLAIIGKSWEDYFSSERGAMYSCVSALWLIEHLPNPIAFLCWAGRWVANYGILLAVVPNDFSPAQLAVNDRVRNPFYWIHHTHINYFTPQSFTTLLERAGFRIVERSTLFPVEEFLSAGQDYTVDPVLGASLYDGVTEHDLAMSRAERLALYQGMAKEGRGRELVYVAVKE